MIHDISLKLELFTFEQPQNLETTGVFFSKKGNFKVFSKLLNSQVNSFKVTSF